MRLLTKSELARMTRLELLAEVRQAASELVAAPEHSPERENAQMRSQTCGASGKR